MHDNAKDLLQKIACNLESKCDKGVLVQKIACTFGHENFPGSDRGRKEQWSAK
jgi:hypothetical protein